MLMMVTYGDVGGEARSAAERELLVHEVQVERVLRGEGGHEAQPLPERHPDVRPKFVVLRSKDDLIVFGTHTRRIQGSAKRWALGCVNPASLLPLAAGESSRTVETTF